MGDKIRGSKRYVACVAQYLTSPLGRGTPEHVARKLIALDPLAINMPDEPSPACLHAIRAFIEAAFTPDNDQCSVPLDAPPRMVMRA